MKRLLLALLLALPAGAMERFNYTCRTNAGPVAASCTVAVFDSGTLNLSAIFSDNGVTPKPNPFTAAVSGQYFFYAADGTYDVRMTNGTPSLGTITLGAVSLGAGGAHPVASVFGRTGAVGAQAGDYTAGQVTNAGRRDAANNWGPFFQDYGQNVTPANPSSGTRRLFVDSADGHLKLKRSNGTVYDVETGGGGGAVTSVFGRAGAVVALGGDYTASQVTNAFDLTANNDLGTHWLDLDKSNPGNPPGTQRRLFVDTADNHFKVKRADGTNIDVEAAAAVSSVFGRVGAVVAAGGDYVASQVTNAFDLTANNPVGAHWADITQIAAPAAPAAGVRRLFVDQATGKISVQTSGGFTVPLETGGTITPSTIGKSAFYSATTTLVGSATVLDASQFAGGDIGAKVNTAVASFGAGQCGTIAIPQGTFTYSTPIFLPGPCTLQGAGRTMLSPGTGGTKLIYDGPGASSAITLGSSAAAPGDAQSATVRDLAVYSNAHVCPNDGMLKWNPAAGGANKWQCYDGAVYTVPLPHLAAIQHGAFDPGITIDGLHNRITGVFVSANSIPDALQAGGFHFGLYINGCEECRFDTITVFGADVGVFLGEDNNGVKLDMIDMQYNREAGLEYTGNNNFICHMCLFQANQWFGHPDDPVKYGAGVRIMNFGSNGRGAVFSNSYFESNHGPDVYGSSSSGDIDVDHFSTVRGNFGLIKWTHCTVPDLTLVTFTGGGDQRRIVGCDLGSGAFNQGTATIVKTDITGTMTEYVSAFGSGGTPYKFYELTPGDQPATNNTLRLRTRDTTETGGLSLENVLAATAINDMPSAELHFRGNRWNGAASAPFQWMMKAYVAGADAVSGPSTLFMQEPGGAQPYLFRSDGHFRLNGLLESKIIAPTVTVYTAQAGTDATCVADGQVTTMTGNFMLTTGSGAWGVGAVCDVTFPNFLGWFTISPANAAAAAAMNARQVYVGRITNGFRLSFGVADVAATAYQFNWIGVGMY